MGLSLRIENVSSLPDGGPLSISVAGKRGIDIGRDQHLDWTLPDPTRFISGKHCEIRYKDGDFWLTDVSTNGTYLNGSEERMRSPHRLRTGDQIEIGSYIVVATIEGAEDDVRAAPPPTPSRAPADLWQVDENVAAPMNIAPRRPPREAAPPSTDFLDQIVDSVGRAGDEMWNVSARGRVDAPGPAQPRGDAIWGVEPSPLAREEPAPLVAENLPIEAPPQPPMPIPAREPPAMSADFVRALARGANVPESTFARYTPEQLAELVGGLLRLTTENLRQLLVTRSELKDIVRITRTMVVASDNNPLKLAPTVEDALGMMFAPASSSYLNAQNTFDQSFKDLKHHQIQTYSAMQLAVSQLAKDMDPNRIAAETEPDRGVGALVGSRKARFWDTYVTWWRAKVERHEDGLLGTFLDYFSECYDRAGGKRP